MTAVRHVPLTFLLLLLLSLCGLSGWQWHRESQLRAITLQQRAEIARLTATGEELASRTKAGDAEILRLTASLGELRTGSVSKAVYEEVVLASERLRESIEKQNAAIKVQNEALATQIAATQTANDTIKSVTVERDATATKLNDLTARFNELTRKYNDLAKGQ